jgi:hypothetical protein
LGLWAKPFTAALPAITAVLIRKCRRFIAAPVKLSFRTAGTAARQPRAEPTAGGQILPQVRAMVNFSLQDIAVDSRERVTTSCESS